jgi:hypothetical protein
MRYRYTSMFFSDNRRKRIQIVQFYLSYLTAVNEKQSDVGLPGSSQA